VEAARRERFWKPIGADMQGQQAACDEAAALRCVSEAPRIRGDAPSRCHGVDDPACINGAWFDVSPTRKKRMFTAFWVHCDHEVFPNFT
jgi:hypothetical protein